MQLESLLNATIDKNFDKLEIYTLRNLLTVSNVKEDEGLENWIMLDHYREIDESTTQTAKTDDSTLETLSRLRKQVQETDKLHRALKAEVARNEALLSRLKPLGIESQPSHPAQSGIDTSFTSATSNPNPQVQDHASFSFLTSTSAASDLSIGKNSESQPLAQNTKFTASQLPALKRLLDELRPHLGSVPKPGMGSESQRAREAYIESESRKAMIRNGIEPGAGEGGGAGRLISAEEIGALESVAGALEQGGR